MIGVLLGLLIGMKLTGFIAWSWFWVLFPLWGIFAGWLLALLLFTVAAFR